MSARTITLPRVALDKLFEGRSTVRLADSEGQLVALFPQQVWPSARVPALQPSLVLSSADLDVIEQDPVGLVCAPTDGTTGWTVRVA